MVDVDEVRRVAENARIDVSVEEVEEFVEEFEEILEMFSKINEVDTEDTEPAFHPVEVEPESREDVEEETLSREKVFQNTDNDEEDKFKGPKV